MLGFLGISVWMDNGSKNLDSFIVKKNKLGFNFQDFLNTKIEGSSIHRRKKKKKRRKGHIVNSWGNRLYFHGSWKDSWIVKNIYHSYFLHNLLDIRKILENLFTWKSVRNHGISLSHIKFFKRFRFIWVKVYIYDGWLEEEIQDKFNGLSSSYHQRLREIFFAIRRKKWNKKFF